MGNEEWGMGIDLTDSRRRQQTDETKEKGHAFTQRELGIGGPVLSCLALWEFYADIISSFYQLSRY